MATFEQRKDKDGNVITIRVKIRRRGHSRVSRYGQTLKERLKSNLLVAYFAKDDLKEPLQNAASGMGCKRTERSDRDISSR